MKVGDKVVFIVDVEDVEEFPYEVLIKKGTLGVIVANPDGHPNSDSDPSNFWWVEAESVRKGVSVWGVNEGDIALRPM